MKFLLAILVVVTLDCSLVRSQESDFFWSFQDLNQGAVNGPAVGKFSVGENVSLFLYYTTNGPSDLQLELGAILDVVGSRSRGIKFQDAEVYNPFQSLSQFKCARWGGHDGLCVFGGLFGAHEGFASIRDDIISEWGAFAFDANGITDNADGSFLIDSGYDANADAFLFGRVDFQILTNTRGDIDITVAPGNGLVVNTKACAPEIFELIYGSARIEIVDSYLLGDVNADKNINLLDVAPFVELLCSSEYQLEADVNLDGVVDLRDGPGFVDLIVNEAPPFNPPVPDPQTGQIGDVNCDGYVDMIDGQCLIAILLDEVDACDPATADINQDGEINIFDYELITDVIVSHLGDPD